MKITQSEVLSQKDRVNKPPEEMKSKTVNETRNYY